MPQGVPHLHLPKRKAKETTRPHACTQVRRPRTVRWAAAEELSWIQAGNGSGGKTPYTAFASLHERVRQMSGPMFQVFEIPDSLLNPEAALRAALAEAKAAKAAAAAAAAEVEHGDGGHEVGHHGRHRNWSRQSSAVTYLTVSEALSRQASRLMTPPVEDSDGDGDPGAAAGRSGVAALSMAMVAAHAPSVLHLSALPHGTGPCAACAQQSGDVVRRRPPRAEAPAAAAAPGTAGTGARSRRTSISDAGAAAAAHDQNARRHAPTSTGDAAGSDTSPSGAAASGRRPRRTSMAVSEVFVPVTENQDGLPSPPGAASLDSKQQRAAGTLTDAAPLAPEAGRRSRRPSNVRWSHAGGDDGPTSAASGLCLSTAASACLDTLGLGLSPSPSTLAVGADVDQAQGAEVQRDPWCLCDYHWELLQHQMAMTPQQQRQLEQQHEQWQQQQRPQTSQYFLQQQQQQEMQMQGGVSKDELMARLVVLGHGRGGGAPQEPRVLNKSNSNSILRRSRLAPEDAPVPLVSDEPGGQDRLADARGPEGEFVSALQVRGLGRWLSAEEKAHGLAVPGLDLERLGLKAGSHATPPSVTDSQLQPKPTLRRLPEGVRSAIGLVLPSSVEGSEVVTPPATDSDAEAKPKVRHWFEKERKRSTFRRNLGSPPRGARRDKLNSTPQKAQLHSGSAPRHRALPRPTQAAPPPRHSLPPPQVVPLPCPSSRGPAQVVPRPAQAAPYRTLHPPDTNCPLHRWCCYPSSSHPPPWAQPNPCRPSPAPPSPATYSPSCTSATPTRARSATTTRQLPKCRVAGSRARWPARRRAFCAACSGRHPAPARAAAVAVVAAAAVVTRCRRSGGPRRRTARSRRGCGRQRVALRRCVRTASRRTSCPLRPASRP